MAEIGFFTGRITWFDAEDDAPTCDCARCRVLKADTRAHRDALARYIARHFGSRAGRME